MPNIIKLLYITFRCDSEYYKQQSRIDINRINLIETLNNDQKALLLSIKEDLDQISNQSKEDNFNEGVKVGAKLILELLYKK